MSKHNSVQLYTCLYNSFKPEAMLKVASASDETLCRIGMLAINDGACFLKLVIMQSTVDTHLNVSMIWKNLATLDSHMPSVDSNVDLFNQFVLLQHEA